MNIREEEAITYVGGASKVTASLVSALTKAVSILYSIGQNLGSTIRRYVTGSKC